MSKILDFFSRRNKKTETVESSTSVKSYPELMNAIKVDSLEEATHWIPEETQPYCDGRIIIGKPYKILYDKVMEEHYMFDEKQANTVWWMTVQGYYIKVVK